MTAQDPYADDAFWRELCDDPTARAPRDDDDLCADVAREREFYTSSRGHRRATDATWAYARQAYLAGESAESVCARYGIGVSTLRNRAAAERWRRQDQPEPEPVDLDAEAEAGLPDYDTLARHALVRLNQAIQKGRAPDAANWMRLHIRLLDLARKSSPPPSTAVEGADPPPFTGEGDRGAVEGATTPSPIQIEPDPAQTEPQTQPETEQKAADMTPAAYRTFSNHLKEIQAIARAVSTVDPTDDKTIEALERRVSALAATPLPGEPKRDDQDDSDGSDGVSVSSPS